MPHTPTDMSKWWTGSSCNLCQKLVISPFQSEISDVPAGCDFVEEIVPDMRGRGSLVQMRQLRITLGQSITRNDLTFWLSNQLHGYLSNSQCYFVH